MARYRSPSQILKERNSSAPKKNSDPYSTAKQQGSNGSYYQNNTDYGSSINNIYNNGGSSSQLQNLYNSYLSKVENPSYAGYDNSQRRSEYEAMINNRYALEQQQRKQGFGETGGIGSIESALMKQYEAQQRAVQEGINNAVSQNEAYIPKANQSFDDTVRSAYVTREQAKTQAPEAMAAMGASGGASESALLGLNTSFENARTQAGQQKQSAIDQITQNSANIRASGNTSLANLGADYQGKLAQALQQQLAMQQEQSNWQKQFDFQNQQYDFTQQQYKDQMSQQAWENSLAEKQLNSSAAKARSSGGGGSNIKPLTYAQALAAYEDGIRSPAVTSVLDGALGTFYGEEQTELMGKQTTAYNGMRNSLASYLVNSSASSSGAVETIQSALQSGRINEQQARQLLREFGLN